MENPDRPDDRTVDRTLEMSSASLAIAPDTGSNGSGGAPEKPILDPRTGATLSSRIPEGLKNKRPSPALDPIRRSQVSRAAKWGVLLAALLLILWLPAHFDTLSRDDPNPRLREFRDLSLVTAATVFASLIATGGPRLFLARAFGRWNEPSEAVRDWLVVGVFTGVLYWGLIQAANALHFGRAETGADWVQFRLPLLLIAGIVGLIAARYVSIRQEGVLGSGIGSFIWQIVLQAALLGALERPIEKGFAAAFNTVQNLQVILGFTGLLCLAAAGGIVLWAASADASLSAVRKRRGASGIDDGSGPVNMTLTVIGGRESGKTVLLAAAFYEWSTQNIGNLRITAAADGPLAASGAPVTAAHSGAPGIQNLEAVASELYVKKQFPVGTVSTQDLPFDLSYGQEKIARFTFLDYPGGAIAGRVADTGVVQRFWERVEDTDGILLIADMSYVRRSHKDADWLEVRNAYRTVMQRLVDRNGKRRVVPVALVLTKCDEFVDPTTGHINMTELERGLKEFQYDELETEWRQLNDQAGPGFAEFSTWITSAITYSQPQLDALGKPDYSRPFLIAPPPPTITPTGCASPLLWMCAKVMRWNVTSFYDINSFFMGATPRVRRRVNAIEEMEKIADQRSGRA